jgi:hypothetical protein
MNDASLSPKVGAAPVRRSALHLLLAVAALVWAVVVIALYYRRVWFLLLGEGAEPIIRILGPLLPRLAAVTAVGVVVGVVAAGLALMYSRRRALNVPRGAGDLAWGILVVLGFCGVTILSLAANRHTLDPTLPYLLPALSRQLLGIGGALVTTGAAIALGFAVSRALGWRYAAWQEGLPFSAALGMGLFANLGLVLALLGLYRPLVLQAVVVMVLIVILVGMGVVAAGARQAQGQILPHSVPALPRGVTRLWGACSVLALFCAFVAALAPESQYDAVWYHLAYPQRYLAAGYLVDLPADYVSLFPMTVELWFGYGLALGGTAAAVLQHFALLPLIAAATYACARRFAPVASPWLAVALVVTVPTVIFEASTAYIDLAMMLFITLAVYALLRYLAAQQLQWLLLAALNLGFALASKHLALLAALLLVAGLLLGLWRQRAGWRKMAGAALILGGISLLLALPWYVRSYLATGNPVFPVLHLVFGAPPARWDAMTEAGSRGFLEAFGRARTLPNLLALPWDMTMHAHDYGGTLGPLFLLLLPLLVLRRLRGALPWLASGAALFMLLWASPVSSFQLRHLLPIVPILAVLAAAAFSRAVALGRSVGGQHMPSLLAGGVAVLMVLNIPPFTILHQGDQAGAQGWLTSVLHVLPVSVVIGGEAQDTYLARQIRSYAAWHFAEQTLPPEARVLSWSDGEQIYTRLDRIWANSALGNDAAWAPVGSEQQALAALRDLGITHLLVDIRPPDSRDPWDAYALTGPTARHGWYEELYRDDWYVLYRIRWELLATML